MEMLSPHVILRKKLIAKGHQFKTLCDTEVIIYAYKEWGGNCINKFRGMFAFGIHDKIKKLVFIARDHFGSVKKYPMDKRLNSLSLFWMGECCYNLRQYTDAFRYYNSFSHYFKNRNLLP